MGFLTPDHEPEISDTRQRREHNIERLHDLSVDDEVEFVYFDITGSSLYAKNTGVVKQVIGSTQSKGPALRVDVEDKEKEWYIRMDSHDSKIHKGDLKGEKVGSEVEIKPVNG